MDRSFCARWRPGARRRSGCVALLVFIAAGLLSRSQPVSAGNFQMFPGRLVFDGRGGVQAITIINAEQGPVVITTALDDYFMTPDGGLARIGETGDLAELKQIAGRLRSARPLLMVTPQRMVAAPLGNRVVRVRAAPSAMPPGEYRSHLSITSLPPAAGDAGSSDGQVGTVVKFALRMTIPVIVRVGPRDARAALLRPRLTTVDEGSSHAGTDGKQAAIQVDLARLGTSSIYGTVEVRAASAAAKDPPIGVLKGTAVYPEIESRPVTVQIKRPLQPGERLLISFWDQEKVRKRPLAQIGYQVP